MMKVNKWSTAGIAALLALAAGAGQANQIVTPSGAEVRFVAPGGTVTFAALYNVGTVAPATTRNSSGLGLCLHWDNTDLTGFAVTNILDETPPGSTNYTAQPPTMTWQDDPPTPLPPGAPTANGAPCGTAGTSVITPDTNTQFIQGWVSVGGTWPGGNSTTVPLPLKLYDVTFTASPTFTGVAHVGFSATSTSGSAVFTTTGLTICAMPTVTVTKVLDGSETGPANATFNVALSGAVPAECGIGGQFPVTVNLGGSAVAADYAVSGTNVSAVGSVVTVAFPADGSTTTATIIVTPVDDGLIEGVETVTATVAAGSGNYGGVAGSASANIADNDPTVTITSSVPTIADNGASATITVTLSGPAPGGGFIVPLTLPGANARYSTTCTSSLTVAAGATTATCTVTAIANVVANDGNVPLVFGVNCTSTCSNGSPATANVSVIDDDIPVITVTASPATLTDSAAQVSTITFSTSIQSASPLTVNFTAPAVDARYTTTCVSPIIIPANTSTATCTVTATANTALGDGSATATVVALSGSGYNVGSPATATVTINNDDLATITVAVSPSSVAENSGTAMVYTFTASAPSPTTTSINFTPPAVSGRYTTTCTSPIVIAANATTATCTVTPVNNAVIDGSATATVTLLASAGVYTVGTPAAATGTITDDEVGLGVVVTVGTIVEGNNAVFTLSCNGVGSAVVNYSFTGNYSPLPGASSILVTCGTPTIITVPIVDDATVNGTRTLTLVINSLGESSGNVAIIPGQASATVIITDNDAPVFIPTMSTWGMILMGLLLAGFAGFSVRRRV